MTVLTPEQEARGKIDDLLEGAGWSVQPRDQANLNVSLSRFLTSLPASSICKNPWHT